MDLTQFANLGEFIGGVAVLVTLIDLVVQVCESSALAQAAARREINGSFRLLDPPPAFLEALPWHRFDPQDRENEGS